MNIKYTFRIYFHKISSWVGFDENFIITLFLIDLFRIDFEEFQHKL